MKRFSSKAKLMWLLCGLTIVCTVLTSGKPKSETVKSVSSYYAACLANLKNSITQFESGAAEAPHERLKELFVQSRYRYKQLEWLVEYYFPATAQKLNGPALPEAEPSEPAETQHPSGFQVLEEKIYEEVMDDDLRKEIVYDLSNIANRINRLESLAGEIELTETTIMEALRLNLYRLITKGITGFDSPVSLNSIAEIFPTLESTKTVLSFFDGSQQLISTIDSAVYFLRREKPDFDTFNRALFITRYLNPVCIALNTYQLTHGIPFGENNRAVNVAAKTLFDSAAFDPLFYAPSGTEQATARQIILGNQLFNEPLLSSNGKRSCNTCHQPAKAFTDGLPVNTILLDSGALLRNTPTLLNAGLQPVQFYDSRIAFLEDQVHDVISSRQEMGGLFDKIVIELKKKKAYRQQFAASFPDKKITAANVRTALAAFVRSLIAMNSPFDRYMRGEQSAMINEQVAGFNLFAGKAKCATCHFMPLFSGVVTPLYDKMESEVLGVPANKDTLHAMMDTDSGKYHLYKIPHQLYSFKTTSLRNVSLTAPYMHNGVYTTLEEVIDFYDRGGGAGLGFDLPNQTLPPDRLNLTAKEKKQIVAFLGALTDTTSAYKAIKKRP